MDSFSNKRGNAINMDGSSDEYFRYKMPAITVKHEGKGKMKKSVLTNIREVSESIGRPIDYLMTYLGQKLSATAKVEKDHGLSYVTGHHNVSEVQQQVLNFVQDTVMCRKCHNPETSCHTEGSKKNKLLFLLCKGCGERSDLDSSDRFVKHMISHHTEDASYGHAAKNVTTEPGGIASVALEGKKTCPKCHHKTSKSTCSKCGSTLDFEEKLAETTKMQAKTQTEHKRKTCPTCHHKTSKAVCSKCGSHLGDNCDVDQEPEEFATSIQEFVVTVRHWMTTAEASRCEMTIESVMANVKTDGFTRSTPLDCLGAVVKVIAGNVGSLFSDCTMKVQPIQVAKEAKPLIELWLGMLNQLHSIAGDSQDVIDVVISNLQDGVTQALPLLTSAGHRECVVVGLLLALREVDGIADSLLDGCRRLEGSGVAMKKFMEFLAEEDEEDKEEMDDSESECEESSEGHSLRAMHRIA